jgi:hypothetical protein
MWRTDCKRKEPLERWPGRKHPESSDEKPSRRKGEGSERRTDLNAGETPEGENLQVFFALTGKANWLETKTLRGLEP